MTERQKRVLIVDDEEDLTWTLSKKLSKDNDKFELICVNSGKEAIEVLNQLPVNLAITDVRMPEVSGLELLVQIKDLYPDTKVIIMTAYGTSDVQKEANERGCFKYIEKPFEINELRQLILNAITEKKGFKGSVSDFQLSDIIQLNCLGRLTSALKVSCEGEEGTIYFQEGNIIHAETEYLEGENAFYHIMGWQGGEFSVLRNHKNPRESINKGWQGLLLESLRRVDERSDLAKREIEREKRKRQRKIESLVENIFKSEGVEHIFIQTRLGFPLFYQGGMTEKTEIMNKLGNKISTLIDAVENSSRFMRGKELEFTAVHFSNRHFIMQKIPHQDAYLSILGQPNMNNAFIRLEIKKVLDDLVKMI